MKNKKSYFIVFEGGEACGKSTHTQLLADKLTAEGYKVLLTREPGGTIVAEEIRKVIFNDNSHTDSNTDILLFTAARRDHVINTVLPALQTHDFIICDRFLLSTLVYQTNDYITEGDVLQLHKKYVGDIYPDITILLDIPLDIALKRIQDRHPELQNKVDKKSLEFHEYIYAKYKEYFLREKNHKVNYLGKQLSFLVKEDKTKEEVAQDIYTSLKNLIIN